MEESHLEEFKKTIDEQMRKAFFDKLTEDFNSNPPNVEHIKKLINELCDSLCKFVPSKQTIHDKIKAELLIDNISLETMPNIVLCLIKWIEMFQAPIYDKKTRLWRSELYTCKNTTEYLINFLRDYYEHIEVCHKELFEARQRLINGEPVIPPEHRPIINNIGDIKIKTGR